MKKTALLLFAIGYLFSCNNANNATYKAPDFRKLDTVIYFSGFYVSENYINLLKANKSPKLSQDSGLCIAIPERTLKYAIAGYHFHEGVGYDIVKRGHQYQLISAIGHRFC